MKTPEPSPQGRYGNRRRAAAINGWTNCEGSNRFPAVSRPDSAYSVSCPISRSAKLLAPLLPGLLDELGAVAGQYLVDRRVTRGQHRLCRLPDRGEVAAAAITHAGKLRLRWRRVWGMFSCVHNLPPSVYGS